MAFAVYQRNHGFTRGTPITFDGSTWRVTTGHWDAVVETITSPDGFTAADTGVIEYPFGTLTVGQTVSTFSGVIIGKAVASNKVLLDRSGSTAAQTITNTTVQTVSLPADMVTGTGTQGFHAVWTGTHTLGNSAIRENNTQIEATLPVIADQSVYTSAGPDPKTLTLTSGTWTYLTNGVGVFGGYVWTKGGYGLGIEGNPGNIHPTAVQMDWDPVNQTGMMVSWAINGAIESHIGYDQGKWRILTESPTTNGHNQNKRIYISPRAQDVAIFDSTDVRLTKPTVIGADAAFTSGYVLDVRGNAVFSAEVDIKGIVQMLGGNAVMDTNGGGFFQWIIQGNGVGQYTSSLVYPYGRTEFFGVDNATAPLAGVVSIGGGVIRTAGEIVAGQDLTTDGTLKLLGGLGKVDTTPLGGYFEWDTMGGAMIRQELANGATVFYGVDPGSVAANTVTIGGGVIRAAGNINASGRVGAGTQSPQNALHVVESADGDGIRLSHLTRATSTYWLQTLSGVNNEAIWFKYYDGSSLQSIFLVDVNDPGSVSAGQVSVGGGIIRAAGRSYVGDGAGWKFLSINGGGTSLGDGASVLLNANGVQKSAFGMTSAVVGGAYNPDTMLWSANNIYFIANGGTSTQATLDSSGNFTLSGRASVAGTDPGSVSAGQVTIGGGVGRFSGSVYAGSSVMLDGVTRTRPWTATRYRMDNYCDNVGNSTIISYDDTGGVYKPLYFDSSVVVFRNSSDPGPVGAGIVAIGGGIIRAAGEIYCATARAGTGVVVTGATTLAGANQAALLFAGSNESRLLAYGANTTTTGILSIGCFSSNESVGAIVASFYKTDPGAVGTGAVAIGGGVIRAAADIFTGGATYLHRTSAPLTNGAGSSTATLTNAPVAGNPTKWISIDDNGVTRKIPCW